MGIHRSTIRRSITAMTASICISSVSVLGVFAAPAETDRVPAATTVIAEEGTTYSAFLANLRNTIQGAPQGASVYVDTTRYKSIDDSVVTALASRPDVDLTIDWENTGTPAEIFLPSGIDLSSLESANGYIGFQSLGEYETDVISPIYSRDSNWIHLGEASEKPADVFMIAATNILNEKDSLTMPLYNAPDRDWLMKLITQEAGIFTTDCRLFSPYYQQRTLESYAAEPQAQTTAEQKAYADIRASFLYYMKHYNEGRPFVLAGFSQGGEMQKLLIQEFGKEDWFKDRLVAAYAIGWTFTEDDVAQYPQIKMAQGESDTGVVVSFEAEMLGIKSSVIVPEGVKALSINPLNWKTDSTNATNDEKLGACYPECSGIIRSEVPQMTGAYLDPVRETLIATDITEPEKYDLMSIVPKNFPNRDKMREAFPLGSLHLDDLLFFYRNLQKNVTTRVHAKIGK